VHETLVHILFCFPARPPAAPTSRRRVIFFIFPEGGEKMKNYEIGLTGKKATEPPLRECASRGDAIRIVRIVKRVRQTKKK